MTDNSSYDSILDDQLTPPPPDQNQFRGDFLLLNSPALGQLYDLRDRISRSSDGTIVDYDDMVKRIQTEIGELPSLELQQDVPSGTEGVYQRQLLHALEKINDDHDRVYRKLLKLKSRLVNAINLMKVQKSQFVAFYSLALNSFILDLPKDRRPKFTVKQVEAMGEGEFSRLMDNLDSNAPSVISELGILEMEIKVRKKAQAAKYQLGKDQVNAMWSSFQSNGAIGLDDDPNALLKKFPVEDEDENEIPSFVSRHTKEVRVAASASYGNSTLCSVCGEKQFESPSGATCSNGHGRAPSTDDIKGTFVKTGDPKPVISLNDDLSVVEETVDGLESKLDDSSNEPVIDKSKADKVWNGAAIRSMTEIRKVLIEDVEEPLVTVTPSPVAPIVLPEGVEPLDDIESILNDTEPMATVAPSTPRKRLMLLDDEDIL